MITTGDMPIQFRWTFYILDGSLPWNCAKESSGSQSCLISLDSSLTHRQTVPKLALQVIATFSEGEAGNGSCDRGKSFPGDFRCGNGPGSMNHR